MKYILIIVTLLFPTLVLSTSIKVRCQLEESLYEPHIFEVSYRLNEKCDAIVTDDIPKNYGEEYSDFVQCNIKNLNRNTTRNFEGVELDISKKVLSSEEFEEIRIQNPDEYHYREVTVKISPNVIGNVVCTSDKKWKNTKYYLADPNGKILKEIKYNDLKKFPYNSIKMRITNE